MNEEDDILTSADIRVAFGRLDSLTPTSWRMIDLVEEVYRRTNNPTSVRQALMRLNLKPYSATGIGEWLVIPLKEGGYSICVDEELGLDERETAYAQALAATLFGHFLKISGQSLAPAVVAHRRQIQDQFAEKFRRVIREKGA